MLSAFISAMRLVWPFIRELLFKNKGAKHSIEKNRDLNIMFGLLVGMFALSLYLTDHALSNHRYYTEQMSAATLSLDRFAFTQQLLNESREEVKRMRNTNETLQDDLRTANNLVISLSDKLGPAKTEVVLSKELTKVDTPGQRRSLRERLKELNQKIEPGKPSS